MIYLIRQSNKLRDTEKELALTMLTIFDDIGILLASLTSLVLSTTIFKTN